MNKVAFAQHFQTRRVSIYQNGIAFFYKNGQVADAFVVGIEENKGDQIQIFFVVTRTK